MKNLLKFIMCLLFLWSLVSCNEDFLDQTQTTDLDENKVFSDSAYTAGFLTQIYVDVGFDTDLDRFNGWGTKGGGLQVASDEAEFIQSNAISTGMMFATGTVNPVTVTTDVWEKCYRNIRRANLFMKKVDGAPIVESVKQQYKSEARALRAWYYFILLRHYGGIPLIGDKVYGMGDEIKTTRNTFAECVNYIVSECNSILDSNTLSPRMRGRNNGRVSEAFCHGLISRVLLYAASPLFNGSGFGTDETRELLGYPDYDKNRWKDALDAARKALTMTGNFRLFDYPMNDQGKYEPGFGFYAIFFPPDFNNITEYEGQTFDGGAYCELIFEKKGSEGTTVMSFLDPPSCGGRGDAGYIYKDLADAFPMIDGKPIGESAYTFDPLRPNVNRDPRFANTVIYDSCKVYSGGDANHIVYTRQGYGATMDAVHSGTPTGFYIRKMINRNCAANYWVAPPQNRPLIRYAEILLNYAEAANEFYGPDYTEYLGEQEMSVYTALKLIRKRAGINAGINGMYGLKPNMTQEEMREAIRLERRLELAFEGFRFFDVRRWMIAEQTDNAMMHGLEITGESNGSKSWREFNVRKHVFRKGMYFWPIPYQETVKSPDLLQNPFYD